MNELNNSNLVSNPDNTRLTELEITKEKYRSEAFRMIIQIAFIFGVPAIFGFFGGRALDQVFGTGKNLLLVSLAGTFIFSWTIIIIKYKNIDAKLKKIDQEIKSEKEKRKNSSEMFKPINS